MAASVSDDELQRLITVKQIQDAREMRALGEVATGKAGTAILGQTGSGASDPVVAPASLPPHTDPMVARPSPRQSGDFVRYDMNERTRAVLSDPLTAAMASQWQQALALSKLARAHAHLFAGRDALAAETEVRTSARQHPSREAAFQQAFERVYNDPGACRPK